MALVVFALSSCGTEQSGPTGEEAASPREVTKEVTRTVTVAEAPEAPEAKRDARAAPVPAQSPPPPTESGPDHVTVADGSLSVEVPSSWGEVTIGEESEAGSSWSEFAGESVDHSLTAAPSLASWGNAPGAPGVYAVASAGLAQQYANEELVAAGPNDLSGSCEAGMRRAFEREPYIGLVQEWENCGEDGGGYLTLAATPRDGGCVVLLTVGTADLGGAAAGRQALDTFEFGCGAAGSYPLASTEEQYAPDQDAPNEEPTAEVDCSGFTTTFGQPSQWQAQQFHDFVATPEQRAILDPDGDGFACDDASSGLERTQYEPEETTETEVTEPPDDEERVPLPTDQYGPLEPAPQLPGDEDTDESPPSSEPPPSSSGYPSFPGDPFNGPTCDDVGGGPYSVPPGSPRDAEGDGVACE